MLAGAERVRRLLFKHDEFCGYTYLPDDPNLPIFQKTKKKFLLRRERGSKENKEFSGQKSAVF